jgi:hypothetical protein
MKRLLALLALPALLAPVLLTQACGGGDDIVPKAGTWTYGGSEVVSNTCKGDPLTDPAGNFTITLKGDGVFTVNDDDFSEAFDCSYSGDEYSCPDRAVYSEKVDNIDATINGNLDVSGTLISATEVDGTQTVSIDCAGASCALAMDLGYTFPCSYSYTFTATAN